MADLTAIDNSVYVSITDSASLVAKILTATPSSGDEALAVREVQRGQGTMATSIPVTIASDQTALTIQENSSYLEDSGHVSGDRGSFVLAVRNDTNATLTNTDLDYSPFSVDSSGRLKIVLSGTGSGQYAEDSGHTTADIGNFVLAVRNDTGAVLAGTDLDYIPFTTDSTGALRTTNSSAKVDDSTFSISTDSVSPSGFLADETSTDSVDEGDIGLARMTLDRKILTRVVGANDAHRLDVDANGNLKFTVGDSGSVDAFSRLRASEPFTIFDSKFTAGSASDALFWDTSTATGGTSTFNTNQSTWDMAVTTTSGSSVIRQTRQYFSYQPGKSLLIFMTGVMGAIKANVRQRIGYFDANNGIFFEQDGTNLKVVRRTYVTGSPVDNVVNQSSWNIDPLDGTGTSGITLDMSKTQILVIDLQWLGVGRVRMGFDINGSVYYCHQFLNANNLTEVYMTTPCLPIRYEITNTGTSASSTTMKAICSCVLSESGYNPLGVIRSAITSSTAFSYTPAVGTYVPVISIRLKSTSNRVLLELISVHMVITNTSDGLWRIEFNPTLTGASWTSVGTNANSEFDISATALSAAGEILLNQCQIENSMQLTIPPGLIKVGANIAGTSDIMTISLTRASTSAASIQGYCSLVYRELI